MRTKSPTSLRGPLSQTFFERQHCCTYTLSSTMPILVRYLHLAEVRSLISFSGVPETLAAVNTIFTYLNQLPPSEADRGLMLPICLAGAMTDDSLIRGAFKRRLSLRDENIGNLLPCRVLMEAVWQKRDRDGGAGRDPGCCTIMQFEPTSHLKVE